MGFATIEGASKSKKAMNGRRFGANLVEAEYFSEDKYHAEDFSRPTPNTDEPRREHCSSPTQGLVRLMRLQSWLSELPSSGQLFHFSSSTWLAHPLYMKDISVVSRTCCNACL